MAVDIHRLVNTQDSTFDVDDFKKVIAMKAEKLFNLKDAFDPEHQNYDYPVKNLNPEITIAAAMTLPKGDVITPDDIKNLDKFMAKYPKIFSRNRAKLDEKKIEVTYVSDGRARRTKEEKMQQMKDDAEAKNVANYDSAKLKIIRYWKFMKINRS